MACITIQYGNLKIELAIADPWYIDAGWIEHRDGTTTDLESEALDALMDDSGFVSKADDAVAQYWADYDPTE